MIYLLFRSWHVQDCVSIDDDESYSNQFIVHELGRRWPMITHTFSCGVVEEGPRLNFTLRGVVNSELSDSLRSQK